MSASSSSPNGTRATLATSEASEPVDDRLPDCVIASSNRFSDLRGFCDEQYASDPLKWNHVLPWYYPQTPSLEEENDFLRSFFSEIDIHMQGFAFVSQAWKSIAMWNFEQRIPSIGEWWLEKKDNQSILQDPAMREHICKQEATASTFFEPREIQEWGGKVFLKYVVRYIQWHVMYGGRFDLPVVNPADFPHVEVKSTTSDEPTDEPAVAKKAGVTPPPASAPVNVTEPWSTQASSNEASSATMPTNVPSAPLSAPLPVYNRPLDDQRVAPKGYRDYTPYYTHHSQQVQGRKRGNSMRGPINDQRQPQSHPSYSYQNSTSAGFNASAPPFNSNAHGQVMHPGTNFPPQSMPHNPGYSHPGTRTPHQQMPSPYTVPSEPSQQGPMSTGTYTTLPQQRYPPSSRSFTHHGEGGRHGNDRFTNDRINDGSYYSGYSEYSSKTGDARRNSFGSRGGSTRGQQRGGRGRGGRGRDFNYEPTSVEGRQFGRRPSNDFQSKPAGGPSNYNKRRGGAYQENSWRSASDHPQMENALPQRVLSGPDQFPVGQQPQGPAGAGPHLLPPFRFPVVDNTGVQTFQAPALQHPLPSPLDLEVNETYVGADAIHAKKLLVFNIPADAKESEVTYDFCKTCEVPVVSVILDRSFKDQAQVYGRPTVCAVVEFQSHHFARRVLNLRGVELYGKPLKVEVTYDAIKNAYHQPHFNGGHAEPTTTGSPYRSAMSTDEFIRWPNEQSYAFGQAQQAQMNYGAPSQAAGMTYYAIPPSTSSHRANKLEPALSTVQSVNTTPGTSNATTPKKQKKSRNQKQQKGTPKKNGLREDAMSARGASTTPVPNETPTKANAQNPKLPGNTTSDSRTGTTPEGSKRYPGSKASHPSKKPEMLEQSQVPDVAQTSGKAQAQEKTKATSRNQSKKEQALEKEQMPDDQVPKKKQVPKTEQNPKTEQASKSEQVPKSQQASKIEQVPESEKAHKDEPIGKTPNPTGKAHTSKESKKSTPPEAPKQQITSGTAKPGSEKGLASMNNTPIPNTGTSTPPGNDRPSRQPSSSTPDDRPSPIHRKSDSDQVDESFYTASASPPTATNAQNESFATGSADASSLASFKTALSPKTAVPSKSKLTISTEVPTSSKMQLGKQESDSLHSKGDKTDPGGLVPEKGLARHEKSETASKENKTPAVPDQNTSRKSSPEKPIPNDQPKDSEALNLPVQRMFSGNSMPPTPAAAYQTAPTTPTTASEEKPSAQKKVPAKKGPSHTESFSMFGKKQKQQQKKSKGKGSVKGRPQDTSDTSSAMSSLASPEASNAGTSSLPATSTKAGKKPVLHVKTRADSTTALPKAGESETSSAIEKALSRERNTSIASEHSSPTSIRGKITSLIGGFADDELTKSKAPPKTVTINSASLQEMEDHVGEAHTEDENVDSLTKFDEPTNDSEDANKVSNVEQNEAYGGPPDRKEPKKKRKKSNKSKKGKRRASQGSQDESAAGFGGAIDPEFNDVESDNRSDESFRTPSQSSQSDSVKSISPETRKLIEKSMAGNEHLIKPRAPRNFRMKRKASTSPANDDDATPRTLPSTTETEISQQNRLLASLLRRKKLSSLSSIIALRDPRKVMLIDWTEESATVEERLVPLTLDPPVVPDDEVIHQLREGADGQFHTLIIGTPRDLQILKLLAVDVTELGQAEDAEAAVELLEEHMEIEDDAAKDDDAEGDAAGGDAANGGAAESDSAK